MIHTINVPTPKYRFNNASRFANDVVIANNYYLFVGDHIPHSNSDLQTLSSDNEDTFIFPEVNMIFGKKVLSTDVSFLIKNNTYAANVVYTQYDDANTALEDETFYVIVDEGSYLHIWKCLDNNNGTESTIIPNFAAGSSTILYRTADGYQWKYMASVSSATANKFLTSKYFPIVANTQVINAAIGGAFDMFIVENQGARYNNYIDGTFASADIRFNGDLLLYAIANNIAQPINGYYTGCQVYLSSGTGAGQYRTITDYVANSSGNLFRINSPWSIAPTAGTEFEIRPTVQVNHENNIPTINCVARALINTLSTNSIYRVEILERGKGYLSATANVIANAVVGVSNTAVIRPVNGPSGGHGSSPYTELFCKDVELSVSLSNTIGNTIPSTNMFQQIGLIKNPLFANVNIRLVTNFGNFSNGETIAVVGSTKINHNVTINSTNNVITCNTADWANQVSSNNWLILQSGSTYQLTQVNTVINATAISIYPLPTTNSTSANVSLANIISTATVTGIISSNSIFANGVSTSFNSGSRIMGMSSGASGYIDIMIRNGETKAYDTFVQLYKYTGSMASGSLIQNELVNQGNTSGYFYSIDAPTSGVLYFSNFTKQPFTTGNVVGNTSLSIATLTTAYDKEVIADSGEILYVENIDEVNRTSGNTETFQLIFNF